MTDIETSSELGILGVGAIAEAIVTGLCGERDVAPSILLSPRGRARSLASRYPSDQVAEDNESVVSRSRVVLLAMRPQDADPVVVNHQVLSRSACGRDSRLVHSGNTFQKAPGGEAGPGRVRQ